MKLLKLQTRWVSVIFCGTAQMMCLHHSGELSTTGDRESAQLKLKITARCKWLRASTD